MIELLMMINYNTYTNCIDTHGHLKPRIWHFSPCRAAASRQSPYRPLLPEFGPKSAFPPPGGVVRRSQSEGNIGATQAGYTRPNWRRSVSDFCYLFIFFDLFDYGFSRLMIAILIHFLYRQPVEMVKLGRFFGTATRYYSIYLKK